jgi:hypothetical protein
MHRLHDFMLANGPLRFSDAFEQLREDGLREELDRHPRMLSSRLFTRFHELFRVEGGVLYAHDEGEIHGVEYRAAQKTAPRVPLAARSAPYNPASDVEFKGETPAHWEEILRRIAAERGDRRPLSLLQLVKRVAQYHKGDDVPEDEEPAEPDEEEFQEDAADVRRDQKGNRLIPFKDWRCNLHRIAGVQGYWSFQTVLKNANFLGEQDERAHRKVLGRAFEYLAHIVKQDELTPAERAARDALEPLVEWGRFDLGNKAWIGRPGKRLTRALHVLLRRAAGFEAGGSDPPPPPPPPEPRRWARLVPR